MCPQPSPEPIERLLAERAWLRRLAGALVRDVAAAEDLTQDVYVTALENAPAAVRSPRAWLGTVLRNRARNRAREEARRGARQARSVRAQETEPTDRAVARAELVERVGRLVLALPEPYRSTIVLRFFEDLPPRKVAIRQGVPVETVRTRTRRGLKILEGELDALHAGRRERWLAALLPWAGSAGMMQTGAVGAGIMATKGTLSAAWLVVALLVGAVAWFAWDRLGDWAASPSRHEVADGDASSPTADAQLAGRARPAAPLSPEARTRALRVLGRVVDDQRRPVAGAIVVAAGASTVTEADGRFAVTGAVPTGEYEGVVVRARSTDGRVAAETHCFAPDAEAMDAGTLVLQAGHGLEVQVRGRGGDGIAASLLVLALVPPGAAPVREIETDGEGRALLADLPAGAWRIFAVADGMGRGESRVWLPRFVGGPCTIELDPPRDVRLRVLDNRTDQPVVGATVALFDGPTPIDKTPRYPRLTPGVTDARGETTLVGIGRGETPHVLITGAGVAFPRGAARRWWFPLQIIPRDVTQHTCKVYRPEPVRWRILPGEVEPPSEGTILRLLGTHEMEPFDPHPARITDGHVVADGTAHGDFAVTADGRIAHLVNVYGTEKEPTTSFRRARRITVRARDTAGRPVPGLGFRPLGSNDNPLVEPAHTDEEGVAILAGLHGGVIQLWRAHPSGGWHDPGDTLEVDLEAGDAEVDVTLPRQVEVTLHVRLNGEPRLPGDYHVFVNRILVPEVHEDAEAATLRFTWWPTTSLVQVVHLESSASLLGVARLPAEAQSAELEIDLLSAGAVYARVQPPADGQFQLSLESAGDAGWQALNHIQPVGSPVPPDGHVRFAPVPSGRYRVVDLDSGVGGAPFEVAAGGPPAIAALDLGDVVTVMGRVEVPEGRGYDEVRVAILPEGPDPVPTGGEVPTWRRVGVLADGRFRARVRMGADVTVRAEHPVLRPDPLRGTARVSRAAEEVVLALVASDEAVLRLDPPVDFDGRPRMTASARLYRGEPQGAPEREPAVTLESGLVRIAGYTPGTWTLWLDLGVDLPLIFRDVVFGSGTTDLGTASLEGGASLKVRVLVPEGRAVPFLGMFATRVEEPAYKRYLLFQYRESELELTGLLPGTWKLDILHEQADRLPKEVTVGENETVELVLDLH